MLRNPYIGDVPATGGVPLQAEARAYFARMTTPPSQAFREAVNWAIWRWKKAGHWALIKGLWLHAAESSQAALLSVIGDTPRDAVILGSAPTFTPLKGFSGFDATHQLKWPITSAILASDAALNVIAGRYTIQDNGSGVAATGLVIVSDAGELHGPYGNWTFANRLGYGLAMGASGNCAGVFTSSAVGANHAFIYGGGGGFGFVTPGGVNGAPNSTSARSSNYRTAVTTTAVAGLRIAAYGWLSAAASEDQCIAFQAILAELLEQLGALA
jgi:hypothetical protein